MPSIHPHINFNGNAMEAFSFYKSVFGGDFAKIVRFSDIASEDFPIPESEADKLMHIALPIGNHYLTGNDILASMGSVNEKEDRSKIYLTADTKDEAEQLYSGLCVGGQVEIPLAEDASGACFAMFRDKFGIEWMVRYEHSALP
jgi:PhnB protein